MTGKLAHRFRLRRDESGVTIVEVTLTMLILAIVLTVAFDFLDRTSKITVKTDTHARAEDETQRALRTVTQHLRGALPITGACTTADFPTGYGNCVQFTVPRTTTASGTCNETRFVIGLVDDPSASAPADEKLLRIDRHEHSAMSSCPLAAAAVPTSSLTKVYLVQRVVNNATSEPLFTYYNTEGQAISTTTAAGIAAVPKAATVKVSLHVRYRTGSPAISLDSSAALRNNIIR